MTDNNALLPRIKKAWRCLFTPASDSNASSIFDGAVAPEGLLERLSVPRSDKEIQGILSCYENKTGGRSLIVVSPESDSAIASAGASVQTSTQLLKHYRSNTVTIKETGGCYSFEDDDGQTNNYRAYSLGCGGTLFIEANENDVNQLFRDNMRFCMEQARKIAALEESIVKVGNLANMDPLTKVFNRRGGEEAFESLMGTVSRNNFDFHNKKKTDPLCISVMLMDIDYFKRINDELGHDVGDRVLEAVAAALKDAKRNDDMVVRWGGDEFVVAGAVKSDRGAEKFAQKIINAVNNIELLDKDGARIKFPDGSDLRIGLSVGVAMTWDVDGGVFKKNQEEKIEKDNGFLEELCGVADTALYQSKSTRGDVARSGYTIIWDYSCPPPRAQEKGKLYVLSPTGSAATGLNS
ncbi:MAG: GGDEF domain-containing protein [Alphaproteobacteria bacterium]|nr:GGDEF domain-containing protein [Alphaproteobacteria bacterium]